MTTLASDIITDARKTLIDTGSQPRWTDDEMLGYLSDGLRTMMAMSPSLMSTRVVQLLAAGARQTLPADGYMLLDVVRNMGLDGTSPGRAVRIVNRELMDAYKPTWTAAQASPTAQNYIYSPTEPRVFYVYPPASGAGYVEMIYAKTPDQITALTDVMPIDDAYRTGLLYYVLFRAYAKDNDFGTSGQAGAFLTMFQSFMGGGRQGDLDESPNQQLLASDMATRGAAK